MKRSLLLISIVLGISAACLAAINNVSLPYIFQEKYDGRNLKLVKVLSHNGTYTRYYITYMSGKLKISGIMNVPSGSGPFPVIITAHGFIDPRYYTNGRGLKREQDYLASSGYAVLHPDYRNHAQSGKDPDNNLRLNLGYTEDVINAVYAIKNSRLTSLDKNNIGILGHSLAGGVALNMMVAKPGLVKAYVLFAPISIDYRDNFNRWIGRHEGEDEGKVTAKYGAPAMRGRIIALYGLPESNPAFWDNVSPGTFIKYSTEPVIVHQGTSDKDVPPAWAQKLYKAFKDNGKDIKLYMYKGEGHEFGAAWPLVMERSVKFFDEYLK